MGKDIYIHVEYRSRKDKKIRHGGEFDGVRVSDFFSVLAGNIYRDAPPLYPRRGLPGDVTKGVLQQYYKYDHFAPGYVSTSELKECIDETKRRCNYSDEDDYMQYYDQIYEYMQEYEDRGEEARMVFWFDQP